MNTNTHRAVKPVAVILDGYTQNPGDLNWDYLQSVTELTVYDRTPPDKIVERAKGAQIVITNKTPLTKETIDALPELKFVPLLSTGYNVVDSEYLAEKGIPVSNIPSYSTAAVAQTVIAYILSFSNNTAAYTASVNRGEWERCSDFCYLDYPLFELGGKTLGIVGFGKIGAAVAKTAQALGMSISAFSPSGKKTGFEDVSFTPLDILLEASDFVTLHCPLNAQTEGMVNSAFIGKMKDGAYLINTSRGAVVDERAVADALTSGKLAGFAADVLSSEPPTADNPLIGNEKCLFTPHIAWAAKETRERLLSVFNANVKAYLEGKPINVVNGCG